MGCTGSGTSGIMLALQRFDPQATSVCMGHSIRKFKMKVYFNKRLIVVESNVAWALPYWQARKATNPTAITWEIV